MAGGDAGLASALQVFLAAVDAVGAASFAYIAVLLYRVARLLGSGGMEAPLGFLLLSASEALGVAAALSGDPVIGLTAYTGTASTALAGLMLIAASSSPRSSRAPAIWPMLLAAPASLDAAAAAAAAWAAARGRGPARGFLAVLASGHLLRSLAVATAPYSAAWRAILAAGEALRAAAAALLAGYYAAAAAAADGR